MELPRTITLIAAMDEKRTIGNKGNIPWKSREDMDHFKKYTSNKIVVMGRKTWESIDCKPLVDRKNIIISSTLAHKGCNFDNDPDDPAAVWYYASLEDAFSNLNKKREICIIGGSRLYEEGLKYASKMVLTLVKGLYHGDVYFPEWNSNEWLETYRNEVTPKSGVALTFIELYKRGEKEMEVRNSLSTSTATACIMSNPYYNEIPYDKTCIGTCSLCGGPVCVHSLWGSIVPDTPKCVRCGAIKADSFGPTIPMKPTGKVAVVTTVITSSGGKNE